VKGSRNLPAGYSRIGDDVALIRVKGKKLIVKSDMLVDKTDVPAGMSLRRVARKSVAMCVSDFAAKGVTPDSFLVSLGLRRGTTKKEVVELAKGFHDASLEWNLNLVGGDTNESANLVIDCTMLGFADKIVPRGGAKPGQIVVTTGNFGYSSAGLRILLEKANAEPKFRSAAVDSVLNPRPKLRLGLELARVLSSSIDSSDGLAISLHAIAEMSKVGVSITHLPYRRDVESFARSNGYRLDDLVMYGGEEYEIVGTLDEGSLTRARHVAKSMGEDVIVIGKTTDQNGRVELSGKRHGRILRKGWIHLS
jgi:thiamine-monophosphate kinase